jgi:hypothetical protein
MTASSHVSSLNTTSIPAILSAMYRLTCLYFTIPFSLLVSKCRKDGLMVTSCPFDCMSHPITPRICEPVNRYPRNLVWSCHQSTFVLYNFGRQNCPRSLTKHSATHSCRGKGEKYTNARSGRFTPQDPLDMGLTGPQSWFARGGRNKFRELNPDCPVRTLVSIQLTRRSYEVEMVATVAPPT